MKTYKPATLTLRWNTDCTLSVLAGGKVLIRVRDKSSVDAFASGWFGTHPQRWGKPQFRYSKEEVQATEEQSYGHFNRIAGDR